MNIREEILREHSKAQAKNIADWIGSDEKRFAELMHLFLQDEYRVVQRSAWILSMVADKHPHLLQAYLLQMIERMNDKKLPIAVKRNVLRVLQNIAVPEKLHGPLMELSFQFLADPKEAIAVRVFAMTVLTNLFKTYPDIKAELQTIIEEELQHRPTAAFISRAKKTLKELNKRSKVKQLGNIT